MSMQLLGGIEDLVDLFFHLRGSYGLEALE